MQTVAGLRTAFLRLRVILVALPLVMPLATVVCASLALRGVPSALYVLGVLGLVWLATRCVKTWIEYRMAIGSLDMATELAQTVAKHVDNGMDPDAAIEASFGFGLGLAVGRFGWTPEQVSNIAFATAQEMLEKVKGL